MSFAKRLLEQFASLGINPLTNQPDYRFQMEKPLVQVGSFSVPEGVFRLFKKYAIPGLSVGEMFILPTEKDRLFAGQVRERGTLLGRCKDCECWLLEKNLIFIDDGDTLYSPSETALIYIRSLK